MRGLTNAPAKTYFQGYRASKLLRYVFTHDAFKLINQSIERATSSMRNDVSPIVDNSPVHCWDMICHLLAIQRSKGMQWSTV